MIESNENNNYENSSLTLSEWLSLNSGEENYKNVFLNMDRALKYIHNHGYCVRVFYPSEIKILNNNPEFIQFNKLMELSKNSERKRAMIKEDIFNSTLVQMGLYGNCLNYLTPEFLKENFDQFSQFIPQADIPYYRGVVQRGASVYFSEFDYERRKRELDSMAKEFGDDAGIGDSKGTSLVKSNGNNIFGTGPITNDKINDEIYSQINGLKDSAFISCLGVSTLVLLSMVVFGIISWFLSIF